MSGADAQMPTVPPTAAEVASQTMDLTIRCALQSYDDVVVACPVDWSVKQLKQHLKDVYPSQPDVGRQRLIFCGRILEDERTVMSYIETQKAGTGSSEELQSQVIQLVVPISDPEMEEGLRRRRMNANNSSNTAQSVNNDGQATATINGQTFQYSFTGTQGVGLYGYPGQVGVTPGAPAHTDNYTRAYAAYMHQYYQNMMMMYAHAGAHQMQMPTVTVNHGHAQAMPQVFGPFVVQQHIHQQHQDNVQAAAQAAQAAENNVAGVDEPHQPRDFLSVLYKAFQLGLLIMVVFSNSSMERCFVVFATILFVWFLQNRRGRAQQDQGVQAVPVQQPQQQANGEGNQNEENAAVNNAVVEQIPTAWNVFWSTCYTFVSSFFLSLLPDNQVPLDGN